MNTFVLVLMFLGAPTLDTIPGYNTRGRCQAAGAEWVKGDEDSLTFKCITAPIKMPGQR
jgi:hypothetical protein